MLAPRQKLPTLPRQAKSPQGGEEGAAEQEREEGEEFCIAARAAAAKFAPSAHTTRAERAPSAPRGRPPARRPHEGRGEGGRGGNSRTDDRGDGVGVRVGGGADRRAVGCEKGGIDPLRPSLPVANRERKTIFAFLS